MIGRILDNRYEIIEEIGNGGMAQVYKARCSLLNRFVAIKVLRKEFVKDDEFLARFKTEAQAAAALSHHNIVSIYDVGREDDIEYIVMEYAEGMTLKEYIKDNTMLSWQEAVDFAVQICRALKCAHKNGIVHRDIKPQNIILTNEGILKVTDFGIARAVSSSSVTITGNTMGSVHYLSPEQAKGGYTDSKSDIYSLGIVMYEMVTGKLPFDGDNPVSIAIKQIQEQPVPPKEYNLAVPLAVENIIMKAMNKNGDKRYQTADEMLIDLEIARVKPDEAFEGDADTGIEATKKIPIIEPQDIKKAEDETAIKKYERPVKEAGSMKKPEKRAIIWAVVTSVVIVSALVIGAIGVLFPSAFGGGGDIEVPELVDAMYEDVKDAYKEKGITIALAQTVNDSDKDEGTILSQNPKAGKMIKAPFEIMVTVSGGIKEYKLENYERKGVIEVKLALESKGIKVIEEKENSDTIPEGIIVRTSPSANAKVKSGDTVTLYVSGGIGDNRVLMPNVYGLTLQRARKIISDNNLQEGEISEDYSDKPLGHVISQRITANSEVPNYSRVDLVVSKGVEPQGKSLGITVPQNKETTTIKIVQDGKVIHNAIHNRSEKAFNINIVGEGSIIVELYYDGVLERTSTVNL